MKLASSPTRHSSMIIFPFGIHSLIASMASSSVEATVTPFPAARPSAFITHVAGLFLIHSIAGSTSS